LQHEHAFFWRRQHRLPPEYREFPNGNDEPRRLLRLNVYFDNPIPTKGGDFEDRGGFWAPVEIWHRDAAHWKDLYQKGMRVLVVGRMEREPWTDNEDQPRETWQINARSVGILPFRIESVTLSPKTAGRGGEVPGRPGTGCAERAEAQEVTRHGGGHCSPPHALASYPQGIAPSTSTGFHALPKIAAPGPHTPAARHLRPSHSIP
jgi:single-strand DNA-binding protein